MLREFSSRLKRSNETLEEFTSLWTRMMIVIHFLNLKPVKIVLEIPFLAAQSGKNPAEIEALIHELALQNILRVEGGTVVDVDRQNIWSLFEADALKKCLLEEREKMFAGVIRK
jgi:hypothetical protein